MIAVDDRHEPATATARVLVLARSFPSPLFPTLGLWTARPTAALADGHAMTVVSPVPYCPPLPKTAATEKYLRFRRIPAASTWHGVPVHHPRLLTGPGTSLYAFEARAYEKAVTAYLRSAGEGFPFDLVHAHFSYPDGAAARRIAERFSVPFVVTEHAPWTPQWMKRVGVRREAVDTVRAAARVVAVSTAVRTTIHEWTDSSVEVDVIPVGVDAEDFPMRTQPARGNQLLFVGFINYMKGIDVLLEAMALLRERGADVRLALVGGGFYRDTLKQERSLRALASSLGVNDSVTFLGRRPPEEVSRLMAECAAVVLPSRAESFGAVLIEALACGTPVVATRCGGPEDIVNPDVGVLVPPEDASALASGIEHVLGNTEAYDPQRLRAHALTKFGLPGVANRYAQVYRSALGA